MLTWVVTGANHDSIYGFNIYYAPDAMYPEATLDPTRFLGGATTFSSYTFAYSNEHDCFQTTVRVRRYMLRQARTLLWSSTIRSRAMELTQVGGIFKLLPSDADDSLGPEPMTFLDELAANATRKGVRVVLVSGNDDTQVPRRGTESTVLHPILSPPLPDTHFPLCSCDPEHDLGWNPGLYSQTVYTVDA
jgi:hypothetical protein